MTPRFAEDFTVFSNTPGNLVDSQGLYSDFLTPCASPAAEEAQLHTADSLPTALTIKRHKRLHSIDSIATENQSTVVCCLAPTASSLHLLPSDLANRLYSAPDLPIQNSSRSSAEDGLVAHRESSPDYYGDELLAVLPSTTATSQSSKKARGSKAAYTGLSAASARPAAVTSSIDCQIATPPPSARKGGRRIFPKLHKTATMQNDQGLAPQHQVSPEYMNASHQQQHQHASLTASRNDVYGYPMSAPATATTFSDVRSFWAGGDPHTASMTVGFAASGAHMLDCSVTFQRQFESTDWTQTGHASQAYITAGTDALQQQRQQQNYEGHDLRQVPLKHMAQPTLDIPSVDHQALYAGSYPTPIDDPFGVISPNGGVNPGLLFSRPLSSSIDLLESAHHATDAALALANAADFGKRQSPQYSSCSAPVVSRVTQSSPPQPLHRLAPGIAQQKGLRRSSSAKEIAFRRKVGDRSSASSPIKSANRHAPARSQSESRGPRLLGRASLPTLAPALNTSSTTPALSRGAECCSSPGSGLGITRSASFGGCRQTGRSSPIRMQQQQRQQQNDQLHPRLSSLTSIPEVNTPQSPASVKFTIDANGRAWVERYVGDDDKSTPRSSLRRNQSARSLHSKSKWDSSGDDSSSTDDEPIIMPSRTTSFVLPEAVKPAINGVNLNLSQRSDHSTNSTKMAMPGDDLYSDAESEAETVMNDVPEGAGDAASELEKLRQMRQKRGGLGFQGTGSTVAKRSSGSSQQGPKLNRSLGQKLALSGVGSVRAVPAISPSNTNLPTRSSAASQSHKIRCICGCPNAPSNSDGFIVQWCVPGPAAALAFVSTLFILLLYTNCRSETCDLWLHGRCINITKRTLPSVYICGFCANTVNAHNMQMLPPGAASSPLAHKSFRTFR